MAVVTGTSGNDSLPGTAGDDTLSGLAGDDTLAGGGGMDTYVVDGLKAQGHDRITDFVAGEQILVQNVTISKVYAGNGAGIQAGDVAVDAFNGVTGTTTLRFGTAEGTTTQID